MLFSVLLDSTLLFLEKLRALSSPKSITEKRTWGLKKVQKFCSFFIVDSTNNLLIIIENDLNIITNQHLIYANSSLGNLHVSYFLSSFVQVQNLCNLCSIDLPIYSFQSRSKNHLENMSALVSA